MSSGTISRMFAPKSIAIIGASNKSGKVGYSLIRNLKKFRGKIFPINLKEKRVQGIKAHHSVLDVKEDIDLAVIAIPAGLVKGAVSECLAKGIQNIVVSSAGFSEIGNKKAEEEIIDAAKGKARILGPNCFGIVNTSIGLDTSFSIKSPNKGKIAFVSQSGALWAAIADWSLHENFGFSKFASLGNMSDIDFSDMIEYLNTDDGTKVIVCYIELLKDGKKFMEAAKKSRKPIVAIKVGKSEAGTKAALSHTGSLAGSYEIYRAAFKQSGVILAETVTEAFDIARFFAGQHKLKGNRAVIVTNAGGPGALNADYCAKEGLDIVKLPQKVMRTLNSLLPKAWSHNNPIDVIGDAKADRYSAVLDTLKKENFYDMLILLLTPQQMTEIDKTAGVLADFKAKSGKAVISCFMGGESVSNAKKYLENKGIPCFFELERAANVLGKVLRKQK